MKLYYFNEVDCFDEKLLTEFGDIISEERREKLLKFRNKADSVRSFIGEILVRYAHESEYGELECTFNRNEYGKLFIENNKKFQFNISHSGKWVICGTCSEEIGVDVEEVRDIELPIFKYILNQNEIDNMNKLNIQEQKKLFFKTWTIKESYIKAVGKGLSIAMDSIEIISQDNELFIFNKETSCKYKIILLELDEKYKFSVCKKCNGKNEKIEIIHVSKEKIIQKLKGNGAK